MRWSAVRRHALDRLAESLRKRIDFHAASYGASKLVGRHWITLDNREIASVGYSEAWPPRYDMPREGNMGNALYLWIGFPLEKILASPDSFLRGLGMIDSRLGKRRLKTLDMKDEVPFVRVMHHIRCMSEGLQPTPLPEEYHLGTAVELRRDARSRKRNRRAQNRVESEKAVASMKRRKKERNPGAILAVVTSGKVPREELDTTTALLFHNALSETEDRVYYLEILTALAKRTRILERPERVKGVIELLRRHSEWKRGFEDWQPNRRGGDRQFSSLLRHLLADHPVPIFMDKAWTRGGALEQSWFIHIGNHRTIYGAPGLPIRVPRRTAACFAEAPDSYEILEALRFAQVLVLGGDRRVADGVRRTRLVREFEDDTFWTQVIRFFIENPLLNPGQYTELVDFIHARREQQPGFSMRGRKLKKLRQQVMEWHWELIRSSAIDDWTWDPSGFEGLDEPEWRIRELTTGKDLSAEGCLMQHCVASYASACKSGKCSIWSLEHITESGPEPSLTIEVENADRVVRQARGRMNRDPNPAEIAPVRRWAVAQGLHRAL